MFGVSNVVFEQELSTGSPLRTTALHDHAKGWPGLCAGTQSK